jgi:hypothetical protein
MGRGFGKLSDILSRRRKMAAKTRRAKKNTAMDELLALLPELDEEGVAFLLEQAKVHHYNMEVEKLNAISDRVAGAGPRPTPAGPRPTSSALRIERSVDGATYHLVVGSDWKMLTAEEMASLVKISRCGEGEEEVSRRLRLWLAKERKDIFLDLGLDGPSIGMAKDIVRLLATTFPPRSSKPV